MRKVWIAVLSLAVAAAFASPAAAKIPSAGNPCPANGSTFVVDTPAEAALIADGFDCKFVHLEIRTSVTPTIATLVINAATISVQGPLTIDNTFSSDSDIFLTAEGGGIIVNNATIRANDHLILECKSNLCPITIDNSVISTPINPALTSGDTRAIAHGNVKITNSTFFGKHKVGVFSQAGTIDWICGGGGAGTCQDPLQSGVAQQLCPGGFPCMVNFADANALRAVCFPATPGVDCGGGSSECQATASGDVNLENTMITCTSHFGITTKTGSINLRGANITSKDALTFQAFKLIDATDATLTSTSGTVTLESKGGDGPGSVCIIITGATFSTPFTIKPGNGCLVVN